MHRSLPIEAELSSPTTRFSFARLEFQSGKSSSFSSSSWSSRDVFLAWSCTSRALEGSRFVGRQFYKMEAGGSRKRLGDGKVPLMSGIFFSSRIRCGLADSESPANTVAKEQIRRGPFPGGAGCRPIELPPDKAAPLQVVGKRPPSVVEKRLLPSYKPPSPETIFLYAAPVTLDVFRRETRGCRDAKAKCA